MTAPTPPNLHQEIDALDEIEWALVALTTADLEGAGRPAGVPATAPCTGTDETVMPANAGTDAENDVPTDSDAANAVRPAGHGSRPAPG